MRYPKSYYDKREANRKHPGDKLKERMGEDVYKTLTTIAGVPLAGGAIQGMMMAKKVAKIYDNWAKPKPPRKRTPADSLNHGSTIPRKVAKEPPTKKAPPPQRAPPPPTKKARPHRGY